MSAPLTKAGEARDMQSWYWARYTNRALGRPFKTMDQAPDDTPAIAFAAEALAAARLEGAKAMQETAGKIADELVCSEGGLEGAHCDCGDEIAVGIRALDAAAITREVRP